MISVRARGPPPYLKLTYRLTWFLVGVVYLRGSALCRGAATLHTYKESILSETIIGSSPGMEDNNPSIVNIEGREEQDRQYGPKEAF